MQSKIIPCGTCYLKQLEIYTVDNNDSILEDIKFDEIEAPYFQRLFTIILDLLIETSIILAFYFLLPRAVTLRLLDLNPFMKYIIAIVVILSYRMVSISLFGKTIGMMITRVKYLNNDFLPLSSKERLIAILLTTNAKIKFYKTF